MAEVLWTTALLLADMYADEDMRPDLAEQLPGLAQRLANEVWMTRFTRCFATIAERIGKADREPHLLASSTAEEMALHLVIDFAQTAVDDGGMPMDDSLPSDVERDCDFEWAREVLFRDHDVLLLFDDSLDGIDDVESDVSTHYRFANLHPHKWFLPFADVDMDA